MRTNRRHLAPLTAMTLLERGARAQARIPGGSRLSMRWPLPSLLKTSVSLLVAASLFLGCTHSRQGVGHFSPLPASPTVQPANSPEPEAQAVPAGSTRISYEVSRPGDYPYAAGMRVQDLVAAAGGLTDFASGIRVVRGGTNLVNAYYGSPRRTRESKYMETPLEPGDRVWIRRME
jgi:hypothetical protein